jgi:dienelactone hydrolase
MWTFCITFTIDLFRKETPALAVARRRGDDGAGAGRVMIRVGLVIVAAAVIAALQPSVAGAEAGFGPRSDEETPSRRQSWLVPTPDPATPSQATLFRPPGDGPFRLALIAHASTQSAMRRAMLREPAYPGLVAALVVRGFAVLVPQRPGHGATGGPYLEDQGGCADADYGAAAHATADAIRVAIAYMRTQPFIRGDAALVVGHSAGGWGALALAADDPVGIARIIAFAPGRGGQAGDRPGAVCAPERLVAAAAAFGRGARVPVSWLVAQNDSYFAPALSRQMADAFRAAGGHVDFRVLPPAGQEGHWLAERVEAGELASILGPEPKGAPTRLTR